MALGLSKTRARKRGSNKIELPVPMPWHWHSALCTLGNTQDPTQGHENENSTWLRVLLYPSAIPPQLQRASYLYLQGAIFCAAFDAITNIKNTALFLAAPHAMVAVIFESFNLLRVLII
jgi:hypothetical protein